MEQKVRIIVEFEGMSKPTIKFEGRVLSKHMMLMRLGLRKAYIRHLYERTKLEEKANEQRKD